MASSAAHPSTDASSAAQPSTDAFLSRYLRPQWPSMVMATLGALGMGAAAALVGVLIGPCLKIITTERSMPLRFDDLLGARVGPYASRYLGTEVMTAGELLAVLPGALLVFALFKALLGIVQWYLWERTGERVAMAARDDLVACFLGRDPAVRRSEHADAQEADLASAATNDVRVMREYVVHFFGGLPREALQVIFLLVMLLALSPKLTAIFLLGLAPAGAGLQRLGKRLRRRASQALSDYSVLTEWLQQRLLGVETIKHYRTEAIEGAKMRGMTASLYERFLRAARLKARSSPMLEAFAAVAIGIVLAIALRDVARGAIDGSVLLSFFATLALLSQSAAKLGKYLNLNREGAAATTRLAELRAGLMRDQRAAIVAPPAAHPSDDVRIECARISVRYPGATSEALADFSFTFEGGQRYCIMGASGAGKSTLLGVLLGLVKPTSGAVGYSPVRPEARVAYLPQRVRLAPASVGENLAYPSITVDEARAWEALRRTGMEELVRGLPQGIATRVGEGGVGLSGGQTQRILLARLWYVAAPWVIVDEGTSALDPEVEALVHALLAELAAAGAVVVAVAHRRSAALASDQVLLLASGRLVASGPTVTTLDAAAFRGLWG